MTIRKQDKKYFKKLEELGVYTPEGIPKCSVCGKEMINSIDSKTKKISKYLWETTCEHFKGWRLSVG